MAYLVAKYCLVFLITGMLGFVIGRWSMRRLFVDVTDSYETLTATSRAAEQAPWDEIRERFDNINNNVKTIVRNEFLANPHPEFPRGLFNKLEHGLGEVKQTIAALPVPQQVDFSAINQEIRQLHHAIEQLSQNLIDKVATHDDIDSLGSALEQKLAQLSGDIAALPEPPAPKLIDLTPLEEKVAALQASIDGLPQPERTDLSPLEAQLDEMNQSISDLPGVLSHEPLLQHLASLESLTRMGQEQQADAAARFPDLQAGLESIAANVDDLRQRDTDAHTAEMRTSLSRLESLSKEIAASQQSSRTFETLVDNRLDSFNQAVNELLERPVANEINLDPLHSKLTELHDEVAQSRAAQREFDHAAMAKRFDDLALLVERGQNQDVPDMSPIDERLDKIQHQLNTLNAMSAETFAENGRRPSIGPTLLKRAEFGKKDNLQEIAGIGPKLEQSLNRLGVYYYWQIAAWNKRDIRAVDANLEAFRGRIERDDWVRQAKLLRKHAHAAQPPSGREMAQKLN